MILSLSLSIQNSPFLISNEKVVRLNYGKRFRIFSIFNIPVQIADREANGRGEMRWIGGEVGESETSSVARKSRNFSS